MTKVDSTLIRSTLGARRTEVSIFPLEGSELCSGGEKISMVLKPTFR